MKETDTAIIGIGAPSSIAHHLVVDSLKEKGVLIVEAAGPEPLNVKITAIQTLEYRHLPELRKSAVQPWKKKWKR